MSVPAAEHFVVDTHREGTTEIVAIRGGVDISTAPLLPTVLDTVVRRRPWRVEIDLSAASQFGAQALTALVETRRRLADRGRCWCCATRAPIARRLLVRTELVLHIVDDGWAARTAG